MIVSVMHPEPASVGLGSSSCEEAKSLLALDATGSDVRRVLVIVVVKVVVVVVVVSSQSPESSLRSKSECRVKISPGGASSCRTR
jgi:hypothetical protein